VRFVYVTVLIALLAACPGRGTRKTLVPDVPQNGDAQARSRFNQAVSTFKKDGAVTSTEFREIIDDFPEDPIVPWAQLYAGIAAVKERKLDIASKELQDLIDNEGTDKGLRTRAQLFLGITKNYQGDSENALKLLKLGEKAIEGDSERYEYLAAVAYAFAGSERPLASLPFFDQLYPHVTPTERALIVSRVEEVVAAADPNTLKRLFDEIDDRKGPSMAAIASRLAIVLEQQGKPNDAKQMRDAAAPARAAVGLPKTIGEMAPSSSGGDSGLIGAVLPLGGNANRVGEAAVAGLGLAAGIADGKGVAAVEVRAANDGGAASLAVEDLAKANVIAIIGPIESDLVEQAAQRAEGLGVPLLSLGARPEKVAAGRFVFHVRHSAEARARALAARAISKGVTKFAVLAPDSGYGKSVTAAFVDEVTKNNGTITKTIMYPKDTKSFGSFAKKLGDGFQSVFVPEEADKLGLITPALAATGSVPKPLGTKKISGGGHPILLMSTAEGLSGDYINIAGRQSEGAWFAPGYYPDDQDPAQKQFLDRYIAAYAKAPSVTEAYAYDAALLAASASSGGRAALASTLARATLTGVTGTFQFDPDHRRADPGVIYAVVNDNNVVAIRVLK
jgi:ABC-type branched-subunit amino acid transport system substrate-binding protein